MPDTALPSRDSPDLHLVLATPEENIAQQNANSTEWKGALSLEAYLRREEHLLHQTLTENGGLTAWMLVYQDPNNDRQRQVLCGCESIKKKALLAKSGKVEDVVAHGVCSVFCPPQNRGKGYAGRMMSELGKKLKSWQADEEKEEGGSTTAFSVLFSDIGKTFYAARGWRPFPSAHIALPATTSTPPPSIPSEVQTLQTQDLPALCAQDEHLLRQHLASSNRTTVALIPDHATLAWHHAREAFVASELHPHNPTLLQQGGRGALAQVPGGGERVWCYWTRVWANPTEEAPCTLHILRLVVEDDARESGDFSPATEEGVSKVKDTPVVKAIAALLASAQRQAHASGMQEVMIWNPTALTLAAARLIDPAAAVVEREEESIASLQWYGDEAEGREVQWVCNEKYGWC